MDTILSPLMDEVLGCVTGALTDTLGGLPSCARTLMPGAIAPADWCTCGGGRTSSPACGMTWVRLDSLFPSSERFPSPDSSTKGTCAAVLAAVLEVGTYRCVPTSAADGTPPSPAAQTQAALVQADDALAMVRGLNCCRGITSRPYVLGKYLPRDGGGCGGGFWTVTVSLVRR